jgi:hypothetical protein
MDGTHRFQVAVAYVEEVSEKENIGNILEV